MLLHLLWGASKQRCTKQHAESCSTDCYGPLPTCAVQCDRLYGWKSAPDSPVRDAFKRQKDFVMKEFDTRSQQVFLQLNEQVSEAAYCCRAEGVCVCVGGGSVWLPPSLVVLWKWG